MKIDKNKVVDDGYKLISFDVVSLFTCVPLDYTVNIIIDRVFNENVISTTLTKRSLKKLILDSCRKTIFSFNNKLYKQLDGVSMGSSLGPVLANIVMTELEKHIIKPFIDNGIIKFYCRYVDDTLVLVKPSDIDMIHNALNNFHPNLKFTIDSFEDTDTHFLDLLILNTLDIDIYRKDTFSGQYIDYNSFIPWHFKVSWIRSLFYRCKSICSNDLLLSRQNRFISTLMAWNNFPLTVRKRLCDKFSGNDKKDKQDRTSENRPTLWLNVPYLGKHGDFLIKNLEKKLRKSLSDFNLKVIYKTTKIAMFCSNKDPIDKLMKANVVYCFNCPFCAKSYVGKTDRNLITRLSEHSKGKGEDSAIFSHLKNKCPIFNDMINFNRTLNPDFNINEYRLHTILNNTTILDMERNWLRLLFLESYYIKLLKPSLNTGARASRELKLF